MSLEQREFANSMSKPRVKFYHSIRFKLSATIACVIFSAVLVLSLLNAANSLERETESFRTLTVGAASAYAAAVADPVNTRDEMQTLSALRGIRDLPNIVQTDVTLPNGEVFVELGSGAWLVGKNAEEMPTLQRDSIRIEIPVLKGGEQIGLLGMLADIRPLRTTILHSLYITLISGFGVGLIGIFMAQVFVSQLTSPLRKLTDEMGRIRDSDVGEHAIELRRRKDETGLLTDTFSDMISTIRERDSQIADHMDTLEQTVEERTFELRVARDDAEAANAAKSDFLATMSHEIRTPMNGMMVMAEMLGAADLTPRHKRYAEIIHRSGNSLLTIINDILDLSKIEAGHLDLECIPVSPERLITDVASLFWERARASGLDLATYVSPRVPEQVLADPTRINQIVSNLVNNALKFTEQGGVQICLDAKAVSPNTCELIFEVIDTGIGIPEDKIDQIFESFSQADQSTTRRFGGTGLGLTVCQRLVSAMNGDISVSSQPGEGSVFRVEFVAEISIPAPQPNDVQVRVGMGLPNGKIRASLERSLTDLGCSIVSDNADIWLATSSTLSARMDPAILLTDIGDTRSDEFLKTGEAKDVLPNPYQRSEISDLIHRASSSTYRGASAISDTKARAPLESFENLRVLAVDDNAVNREVLREALSTLQADATFAENGEQALQLFAKEKFDIVFMDGSMPVMDGFEATRQIRATEVTEDQLRTTIIALTAQVAGQDEAAWTDAGADDHILKPFTLEKLSSVLGGFKDSKTPELALTTEDLDQIIFDTGTVQTLEKLGTEPGIVRDRIWTLFADKAPSMLEVLQALMRAGPSEDLAQQAHALKSMALSSGFKAIADNLQRLEVKAKTDDTLVEFSSDYEQLSSIVEQTLEEVSTYREVAA